MALDRQSIERHDFPMGRRGYEPEAVDAHLAQIAAEVEELRLGSDAQGDTLSASASGQVRAIIEAAEVTAREIRAEAAREAREQVSRVTQATAAMLQRLAAIDAELSSLNADLQLLEGKLDVESSAAGPLAGSVEAPPPEPPNLEGARLVALNMALNGTPREETASYLAENFGIEDGDQLLDEVYASVADGS